MIEGNQHSIVFLFHQSSVIVPKSLIGILEASGIYVFMVSGEVGIFETVECLCANAQMRMFWVVSLQSHSFVPPLLLQKYSIVRFFFFRFSKGLSASPAFTLSLLSPLRSLFREYRSLFIF